MNIKVHKGDPSPEELAALIGVLMCLPESTSEHPEPPSAWWSSGLPARRPGWRRSGLPRMSQT